MLKRLYTRAEAPAQPDEEEKLRRLGEEVEDNTLAAYLGSSELPFSGREDALMLRYLRAEKGDVPAAAARLRRQAAWRSGFGSVSEEDVAVEIASGKVKLQPPTAGSAGRPLLIVKACRHRPGATPQSLNQFLFYCLEAASHYCWDARNPDGKMVAVFDLAGLQLKNLDAAALRASFHMLAEHFPERMASVWMLEAPTIFYGIWCLVEPFIDRTARKNIHFVSGKAAKAALLEAVGPESLPLEYGGTAAEVPVEVAVQQLPAWRQRQQQLGQGEGGAAASKAAAAGAGTAQQVAAAGTAEHGEVRMRHVESASQLAGAV